MLQRKNYFKIFDLPETYNLNQNNLRKNYYKLVKHHHPDRSQQVNTKAVLSQDVAFHKYDKDFIPNISDINVGFKILSDDYLRAKYMYRTTENPGTGFLADILDIEEDISNLHNKEEYERVHSMIKSKIDECKTRCSDPVYLGRWGYYNRLMNMLEKKKYEME